MQTDLVEVAIILEAYKKGDDGAAGADEKISEILRRLRQARTRQILPMQVGFHKLNRGGVLGNSLAVHRIMEAILHLSFAWKACDHALCMETEREDRSHEDEYRRW